MDAFTMIMGVAGLLLLFISLYEMIAKKAFLNNDLYRKYTRESVDQYVLQEGRWGSLISIGAILLAICSWKELGTLFLGCGWFLIALGFLMIRTASKKLQKK
ncbi:MAG: hypothetical protein Q4F79_06435 [Eubacteriales bacterium]|nr:hypothetical protein [Eubacteriales bacterium]